MKQLEEVFKEKMGFDSFESSYSDDLYTKINQQIDTPNASTKPATATPKTSLLKIILGVSILVNVGLGSWILFGDKSDKEAEPSKNGSESSILPGGDDEPVDETVKEIPGDEPTQLSVAPNNSTNKNPENNIEDNPVTPIVSDSTQPAEKVVIEKSNKIVEAPVNKVDRSMKSFLKNQSPKDSIQLFVPKKGN